MLDKSLIIAKPKISDNDDIDVFTNLEDANANECHLVDVVAVVAIVRDAYSKRRSRLRPAFL